MHDHFFCRYAINKLRGLYYDLHWDSFRSSALANAQTAANVGDGGWPCTGAWNVEMPPEPAQRSKDDDPRGERDGPRKRRRIARDEDVEESEADDDTPRSTSEQLVGKECIRFQGLRVAYFAVDKDARLGCLDEPGSAEGEPKEGDYIVLNRIVSLKEDVGKSA